jgi:hypothetical protein
VCASCGRSKICDATARVLARGLKRILGTVRDGADSRRNKNGAFILVAKRLHGSRQVEESGRRCELHELPGGVKLACT